MPAVTTYDALLSGMTWNGIQVAGRPAFVTYSFETAPAASLGASFSAAFLATFQPFSAADQQAARAALSAWADVSGLTLLEAPAGQGDIRFGLYDLAAGPADVRGSGGFAFNPLVYDYDDGAAEIDLGGDIFIAPGQATFAVLAHEVGHALGLKHPFEGQVTLDPALDTLRNTVMSYSAKGGPAVELGVLDIQAVVHLYGPASADGTQAQSWAWDAARAILTQAGGPGADRLAGVAAGDRISGGPGADYIFARAGDDTISGDDGDDTQAGGDGDDLLSGGAGADLIDGNDGDDRVAGGEGDDNLWGLAGNDTLAGEGGNDLLQGGVGFNRLDGGAGDDVMVVTTGAAAVDGGEGDDQLWLTPSQSVSVSLSYASLTAAGGSYTGVETIVMFGSTASDTLAGGALPDQLVGGAGADLLVGGAAHDQLFGGAGGDTLAGGADADQLDGGAGDDLLVGGEGADTLVGGEGIDTVDFSGELEGLNLVLNTPRAILGEAMEQMFGVENAIGAAYADRITGDAGPNRLWGGGGNDTVAGGDGQNYLRGDEGDDSLAGGAGFDDANGNMGADTVSTGAGDDYCVGGKDNDSLSGGDDYDLVYGNLGADTCDGGSGNDVVRGGQDNDLVMGGDGDDFVSGDKGDDTMTGGAGADLFHTFGDAGLDRVTDFSQAQGDRVLLDPGTQFTVTQVGADTVISMTGGGQMVLVGVQMSTLTPGWIFGA